jgi:hypothetical protein
MIEPTIAPAVQADDLLRLRAYIEQAIVELEHDGSAHALETLRKAIYAGGRNN